MIKTVWLVEWSNSTSVKFTVTVFVCKMGVQVRAAVDLKALWRPVIVVGMAVCPLQQSPSCILTDHSEIAWCAQLDCA